MLAIVALVLAGCASGVSPGAAPTTSAPERTTAPSTSASTASTTTTTTTTAPTTTTTTAPAVETGDLRAGSQGARTRLVQAKLAALKFDPGPVDGRFGVKTTA